MTRADLRLLGLSDARIDHLLRSNRWAAPYRGVLLVNRQTPSEHSRLRAAVKTQPPAQAWVALRTAARLWGLDVGRLDNNEPTYGQPDEIVHLYVPRDARTKHRPGLRLHRAALADVDATEVDGIPVTTPARTVLDLARELAHLPAVVIADSALRLGLCTKRELAEAAARLARLRGVRAARRVADDCDPRSDSPPETVLRLTLVAGGLPRPEPNWVLLDESGLPLARGDLVYALLLIWLEYDGFAVHSTQTAFRNDRLRRRMLERRGWQVKQFTDVDLGHRVSLVREVAELIEAAPARIAALPDGLSPEADRAKAALSAAKRSSS